MAERLGLHRPIEEGPLAEEPVGRHLKAVLGHAATGGSIGLCVPDRGVACAVLVSNLSSSGACARRLLAVPFVGKDVPSRSSEFAHPDVIIGLTVLAYRYSGLRYADFDTVIGHVRATFDKEIGPYKRRKSSVMYEGWVLAAGGAIKGRSSAAGRSSAMMADMARPLSATRRSAPSHGVPGPRCSCRQGSPRS